MWCGMLKDKLMGCCFDFICACFHFLIAMLNLLYFKGYLVFVYRIKDKLESCIVTLVNFWENIFRLLALIDYSSSNGT